MVIYSWRHNVRDHTLVLASWRTNQLNWFPVEKPHSVSWEVRKCKEWLTVEMAEKAVESESGGFFSNLLSELFGSPLNLLLLGICLFLLYKILGGRRTVAPSSPKPQIPKMKKKDFTLEQLREFDGRGPDERILIAVNFKVFDVTRGKRFYGPGMVVELYFCYNSIETTTSWESWVSLPRYCSSK